MRGFKVEDGQCSSMSEVGETMRAPTRAGKAVLLALSALLVVGAAGCEKKKSDSQGGKVKEPTTTTSSGAAPAVQAGTWSGTIEITSTAERTYLQRYHDEGTDRHMGSSKHQLQWRLKLEDAEGRSDFSLSGYEPNARFESFSWTGQGTGVAFLPNPADTCVYEGSGSISGPISEPVSFEGIHTLGMPRVRTGSASGHASLPVPSPCANRPIFGFDGWPTFDALIYQPEGVAEPGMLNDQVSLCPSVDGTAADVAAPVRNVKGTLRLRTSGQEDCSGPTEHGFGDSLLTRQHKVTVEYTYDLVFTPEDESCPDPNEVQLSARWDPWTKTVRLAATEAADATYTWTFGDEGPGSDAVTTQNNGTEHDYHDSGPVDPEVTVKVKDCDPVSASTRIVVDPVNYYAPSIQFDSDEQFFAGDPNDFIRRSALRYTDAVNARCDEILAGVGAVDAARLGSQADADAYVADCGTVVPAVNSTDAGVLKVEDSGGYFLDGDGGDTRRGTAHAPMYAEFVDGFSNAVVVYWLWYPHNQWEDGPTVEIHEGDWEHVVVRLDAETLEAKQVAFYQHYCEAEIHDFDSLTRDNFAASAQPGGHFFVYVARGGHASFPAPADGRKGSCGPSYDFVDGNGKVGRGWFYKGDVRDASKEPWYGFGGAWGDRSSNSTPVAEIDNYGPEGPGPERSIREDTIPPAWLE